MSAKFRRTLIRLVSTASASNGHHFITAELCNFPGQPIIHIEVVPDTEPLYTLFKYPTRFIKRNFYMFAQTNYGEVSPSEVVFKDFEMAPDPAPEEAL